MSPRADWEHDAREFEFNPERSDSFGGYDAWKADEPNFDAEGGPYWHQRPAVDWFQVQREYAAKNRCDCGGTRGWCISYERRAGGEEVKVCWHCGRKPEGER